MKKIRTPHLLLLIICLLLIALLITYSREDIPSQESTRPIRGSSSVFNHGINRIQHAGHADQNAAITPRGAPDITTRKQGAPDTREKKKGESEEIEDDPEDNSGSRSKVPHSTGSTDIISNSAEITNNSEEITSNGKDIINDNEEIINDEVIRNSEENSKNSEEIVSNGENTINSSEEMIDNREEIIDNGEKITKNHTDIINSEEINNNINEETINNSEEILTNNTDLKENPPESIINEETTQDKTYQNRSTSAEWNAAEQPNAAAIMRRRGSRGRHNKTAARRRKGGQGRKGEPHMMREHGAPPKRILYWNDFYGSRNFGFCCGSRPYVVAGCGNTNCQTSKSREEELESFDAIVFHQRALDKDDLPQKRYPHQYYVFLSLEPASYPGDNIYREWNSFFNISMTFRSDSDIFMPYGRISDKTNREEEEGEMEEEKEVVEKKDMEAVGEGNLLLGNRSGLPDFSAKTGFAAWFVSNCRTVSRRENLVEELQSYLPPDSIQVFGSCGERECTGSACWDMAGHHYKFYLSLENSVCKDYVTEKLFEALNHNLLPIVLGGADYRRLLPAHSYINMRDYPDLRQLAALLVRLNSSEPDYLDYFRWKETHSVHNSRRDMNQAHCRLCQFLHADSGPRLIEDLEDWWVTKSECEA